MVKKRTNRLNSLLKEVISETIRKDIKDPYLTDLLTVTRVDITKDLRFAKVYISVIGDEKTINKTMAALENYAKQISHFSSRKVVMRYFPSLTFIYDDSVNKQMRIEEVLKEISNEKNKRGNTLS